MMTLLSLTVKLVLKKPENGALEGKDYPVKDGDVVHFRFNV